MFERSDEALSSVNKAIALKPNHSYGYLVRGILYTQQQETWDLALEDFTQSIKINPLNILAYKTRADFYIIRKKWGLAIEDYSQIIKINPQFPQPYWKRAALHHKLGNKQESIKDLEKAAELFLKDGQKEMYQVIRQILQSYQR